MIHSPQAVMLFAAGFGTRMGALTQDRPKPLIHVSGRPLIDYTLDLVHALKPTRIVANTHYLPDQIEAHLQPQGVTISTELPTILETGGGLKAALPLLGPGPVFTGNTDAIWRGPNPFRLVQQVWQPDRMDALLVCVPIAEAMGHGGHGDFIPNEDGRLTRGPGWIYGGVQIIKTDRLAEIPDRVFSLNRLWDLMLEDKRLFGLPYPGKWCDVGNPQGIGLAQSLLNATNV
ncbi:nucleotidyltransferase family protein [Sedimentitalea nanhaiensis]|uniref:MurNAc alpha-1-phosphate uridylyltransferase n=1 Tax=Sedimentitalea nanhaiensis TaxID=999627 RepID=A0A1I7CB40_9RHOB|nr:nucleotidyltransferase family protein [Sedimentitalea nanhaiensis]SFT96630.1 MurNAc alpha-1-phosphate uridylyltransferase [Sedimentitalea nanhaiensis]